MNPAALQWAFIAGPEILLLGFFAWYLWGVRTTLPSARIIAVIIGLRIVIAFVYFFLIALDDPDATPLQWVIGLLRRTSNALCVFAVARFVPSDVWRRAVRYAGVLWVFAIVVGTVLYIESTWNLKPEKSSSIWSYPGQDMNMIDIVMDFVSISILVFVAVIVWFKNSSPFIPRWLMVSWIPVSILALVFPSPGLGPPRIVALSATLALIKALIFWAPIIVAYARDARRLATGMGDEPPEFT